MKHNPEAKKKRVAEVARQLFVDKGFYAVTIPDIVTESGVSTGTIYKYFGSKSALAERLYEDSAREFNLLLAERLQNKKGAYERAKVIVELLLDLAEYDSTLVEYLFLSRHQGFKNKYNPALGCSSNCILCQIFNEGITQGELCVGDPLAKAVSFMGVVLKNIEMRLKGIFLQTFEEDYRQAVVKRAWDAAYR